ncbi:MAG: GAF domain-containing protein, partial [Chloroflexota bacterium]
ELQAVNEVIGLTTTAATLQDSFDRMAGKLIQVLDMDLVTVSRLNSSAKQLAIVAERDSLGPVNNRIGEFEKLRNMPAKEQVIKTQKSILIEDMSNNDLLGVESKHLIETGASAILVLPLLGLSGVLGTVTLTLFGEERTFSEDQVRLAETIVYQTSTVIENKQLLAETHARALREQKVRTITDKIRSGGSREEIISIAKKEIATLIETSRQQKQS